MRNIKWLRFGLGSCVIAGASVATLLACGDDDNGGTPTGGADAAVDTGRTTTPDSGPGPGPGTDSGPGPALPPAKIQLVNAAVDLGPSDPSGALRVCYGLGDGTGNFTQATLPALPEQQTPGTPFAGLFIGTGGSVPGAGLSLAPVQIQPYLMNAQTLFARGDVKPDAGSGPAQPSTSCNDLFGATPPLDGGALVENVDYWKLPVIPAGTLADGKSIILVLTGCAGDATPATPAKCGQGFTSGAAGVGTLAVSILELDNTTTVDPASIGAQFLNASLSGDLAFAGGQHPGFVHNGTFMSINGGGGGGDADAGDAGDADAGDAGDAGDGGGGGEGAAVAAGSHTDLHQVSGVDFTNDSFTAVPTVALAAIPLPQVLAATYGATVPASGQLKNGASFTFISIGDPAQPPTVGGNPNPQTYHYLALPNDPQTQNYAP